MRISDENGCNVTAYSEWYHGELNNTEHVPLSLSRLRTDLLQVDRSQRRNWRVMNFEEGHEEFVSLYGGRRPRRLNITRGQAMDVASNWCEDAIRSVKVANAGGHGPPPDPSRADYRGDFLLDVHDAMCADYCLASDRWRTEAMVTSGCDCLQLSTREDDVSYVGAGDFCARNSGEVLCREIGLVACHECEMRDFACARREWDRREVPLRGHGNECNGGAMLGIPVLGAAYFLLLLFYM